MCHLPIKQPVVGQLSAILPLEELKYADHQICGLSTYNPISNTGIIDSLRIDVVSIESNTNGRAVTVPKFIFLCGSDPFVLRGLATGVTGIAALGRSKTALPSQLAAAFSFHRKFAICLSPSSSNGIIIIGDVPNNNVDVSKSLTYTPLIINPVEIESGFLGIPSNEYFIGVKSVKVSGKAILFNAKLLSVDKNGYGGTKISTAVPYTVLETSIYSALVQAFVNAMPNVTRVAPVPPFGACFNSRDFGIGSTSVPQIDLVLQSNEVLWSILGANSIVQVDLVSAIRCCSGEHFAPTSNSRLFDSLGLIRLSLSIVQFEQMDSWSVSFLNKARAAMDKSDRARDPDDIVDQNNDDGTDGNDEDKDKPSDA
ncbi:peptidase A1 domain-containing protein [Citrus sinensis]|uniref:Peptidase A1 domain-containing protein n=1 Tax=Citrus sinensis TaxID=2711 RepID=A0ACB8I6Y6_CITSI|nr:peptidase A1 domain-containing protein [Citrus sinensis]